MFCIAFDSFNFEDFLFRINVIDYLVGLGQQIFFLKTFKFCPDQRCLLRLGHCRSIWCLSHRNWLESTFAPQTCWAIANFAEQAILMTHFLSDPRPIIVYACQQLTHSLTTFWNLNNVSLADGYLIKHWSNVGVEKKLRLRCQQLVKTVKGVGLDSWSAVKARDSLFKQWRLLTAFFSFWLHVRDLKALSKLSIACKSCHSWRQLVSKYIKNRHNSDVLESDIKRILQI